MLQPGGLAAGLQNKENKMQYDRRRKSIKVSNDRRERRKEMPSVIDMMVEYQNVRTHNMFLLKDINRSISNLTEVMG